MINLTLYKSGECLANKDFFSEFACARYLGYYLGMTNEQGYELFDTLEEYGTASLSIKDHLAILFQR